MLVKSVSVCIYGKLATWAGTQPPLQLGFHIIVSEKAKQRVVFFFAFKPNLLTPWCDQAYVHAKLKNRTERQVSVRDVVASCSSINSFHYCLYLTYEHKNSLDIQMRLW